MNDRLDPRYVSIAELLKGKGYATGFFGKWHLAGPRVNNKKGLGDTRCYPEKHGFDINLGGCAVGGPFSFFDPREKFPKGQTKKWLNFSLSKRE